MIYPFSTYSSKKYLQTEYQNTGKIIKFINSNFPSYDYSALKEVKKCLAEFREDNADDLKHVRNNVAAHRDNDVCKQLDISENLHLSDAVKLVVEYGNIINELGTAISPIKELGIERLAMVD